MSLQAHHLGSDDLDPGHEQGVLSRLAVYGSRWDITDAHVGLVEHVTMHVVSEVASGRATFTYGSQ